MINSAQAFDLANKALKGNRLKTTGFTLLSGFFMLVIFFTVNFVSLLFLDSGEESPRNYPISFTFSLIQSILQDLLAIGFYAYFFRIFKNKQSEFRDLFAGFKSFSRNIVVIIIGTLVAGLFSSIVEAIVEYFPKIKPIEDNVLFYVILFLIIATIFCFAIYKLYPTWIALLMKMSKDDSTPAIDLIKQTYSQVSVYNYNFLCLSFRVMLWCFLGVFTLGIGFLWIVPLISMSYVVFFDAIFNPEDYAAPEFPDAPAQNTPPADPEENTTPELPEE
ncbi:DUF975 family protein [Fibrobacter sp.]|uniref:DUF975 family protein n=1 Tax=Fibrobacter sp. TaxID=35828 RepID=UPI00386C22C7